jgi:hypothetical protein
MATRKRNEVRGERQRHVIAVDAGRGAEFILNRGVSMKLADVVE